MDVHFFARFQLRNDVVEHVTRAAACTSPGWRNRSLLPSGQSRKQCFEHLVEPSTARQIWNNCGFREQTTLEAKSLGGITSARGRRSRECMKGHQATAQAKETMMSMCSLMASLLALSGLPGPGLPDRLSLLPLNQMLLLRAWQRAVTRYRRVSLWSTNRPRAPSSCSSLSCCPHLLGSLCG